MPEIPDALIPKGEPEEESSREILRWRTVRYRSVALVSGAVVIATATILLVIFTEWRASLFNWIRGGGGTEAAGGDAAIRQARFTNLDGGVRVRKANQVEWGAADFSVGLDKGDVVQTSKDGVARIAFADGTLYVVKPDTLIVIEENAIPDDRAHSRVAVQVTSGVVDLSTPLVTGVSRVLIADAQASIRNRSRALVSNDPSTNQRQILVSKGGAEVRRGGERVELAEYEQASFAGPGSPLEKRKVVSPPILLTPGNMAPVVIKETQTAEVEFTWSAVATADTYRLRVSTSPIFATTLYDRRVESTSVRLPSLRPGDYYWTVTSIDSGRKESQESEANQFSVIRQDNEGEILLEVERYVQHGKVIEIIGRTEPGATVLVNNQPVFNVAPNGSFKHFTQPLPSTGPNRITITAQNSEGKIATLRQTITIQ
ncbi:MAG: hypothetical protein A3H28_16085 [Acidobacteria bacterium RIFCSPLOWO2_02_FULL_61_28]|nr:MAG: hypothetical protein A3H28_16085 [Acidobacteria bacterium RIFCSPLOWO2_02_FULL_61_28]